MKTFIAKPDSIKREWRVVDASGMPLGRLASQVAAILRGKDKVIYAPETDCGDHVIVINCKDIVLTGKKPLQKFYRHASGFAGGLKEESYKSLLERRPEFAVYVAVKGMLPKSAQGSHMLTRLRVFRDAEHTHEAQKPISIKLEGGVRE